MKKTPSKKTVSKKTLLVLLPLLAACSRPADPQPEVASLSTPPSTAPASASAQEERPRERLDMTDEDLEALSLPYRRCMEGHGLDTHGLRLGDRSRPQKEELDKALAECESKSPLPPWERDTTNPEALDFANRVVRCLRDKGVRYVEVVNEPGSEIVSYAFGGPNNDAASISLGLEHVKACEVASAQK